MAERSDRRVSVLGITISIIFRYCSLLEPIGESFLVRDVFAFGQKQLRRDEGVRGRFYGPRRYETDNDQAKALKKERT